MTRSARSGLVSATGFLAENWLPLSSDGPQVILNPGATALDGLGWCYGEIASLCAVAAAMGRGDEEIAKIYLHRLQPLADVLEWVIDRLITESCSRAGGTP